MLNLKKLILITVFCLPLYLVRINLFQVSINILDLMILGCVLAWLVSTRERNEKIKLAVAKNKFFFSLVLLLLLGLFLGSLKSSDILSSLGIIKSWFVLPLIFSFLALQVFQKKSQVEAVFQGYFLSALAVALFSLGYFLVGNLTYDFRLAGIYNSPNYLAMYLAPAFIFGIQKILEKKSALTFSTVAPLVLLGVVVFLTKSYASWLAIGVVFLGLAYFYKKNISQKVILIFFSLVLLMSFWEVSSPKVENFLLSDRSSWASRKMIWEASIKIVEDNWFLGIGPGNFQEKYLEYQKYFPPYLEWAVPHAHNLYLNFWLSGGLLSLLAFLGIISWIGIAFWKDKNKRLLWGVLGVVAYFLLHGLLDTAYFKNDLAVIFWLSTFYFMAKD